MKIMIGASEHAFGVFHSPESYVKGETREETFRRLASKAMDGTDFHANRLWIGDEKSHFEQVYLLDPVHDIAQPSKEVIELLAHRGYVPTPHELGNREHAFHIYEPSDAQGISLARLAFHHVTSKQSLDRLVELQRDAA